MFRILQFLFAAALIFSAAPGFADTSSGNSAADIAAGIQNTYAAMNAFSGTFTQELHHAESGAAEKREGSLLFQKPLRVRWETNEPSPELLLVSDTEVWDYLPDENVAYRHSLDIIKDSRTMLQIVTGQSRLDRDFNVEREPDKDGFIALRLYPKEPTAQMVEALLLVNPATFLLKSAEITDFYSNTNKIEFKSMIPDAKIPDNSFSFTPPKGVSVEQGSGSLR